MNGFTIPDRDYSKSFESCTKFLVEFSLNQVCCNWLGFDLLFQKTEIHRTEIALILKKLGKINF